MEGTLRYFAGALLLLCHDRYLSCAAAMAWYAAEASRTGGITVARRARSEPKSATFTSDAFARWKLRPQQRGCPGHEGSAALVPPNDFGCPSVPRVGMFSAGALTPLRPVELPKFDSRYERGTREPDVVTAMILSLLYDLPFNKLFLQRGVLNRRLKKRGRMLAAWRRTCQRSPASSAP